MALTSRFIRLLQLFLALYISAAMLYTTTLLFVSVYSAVANLPPRSASPQFLWPLFSFGLVPGPGRGATKQQSRFKSGLLQINTTDPFSPQHSSSRRMGWFSSEFSLEHGLGRSEPVFTNEDIFLSKAFSGSMHPSKILPYFYRASGQFDLEDITIATLITSNRFQVFKRLVKRYKGASPLNQRCLYLDSLGRAWCYRTYLCSHSCPKYHRSYSESPPFLGCTLRVF